MAGLIDWRSLKERSRFGMPTLSGRQEAQESVSAEADTSSRHAEAAVKAFRLQTLADLQVVLSAMILSECVYKLVDMGEAESAQAATFFVNQFPPGFANLLYMQGATLAAHHRYMLGADDSSLYVVLMGTKHVRDLVADANLLQEAVWQDEKQQSDALAHRGFLARSRRIPVEALYAHARKQGKRLVLCGHSLGGAVALLCTLRLLRWLNETSPPLQCICFGTPAIGNAALAALVHQHGWEEHILNFILPEDIIPRMLALPATAASSLPGPSAEAEQLPLSKSTPSQVTSSVGQQRLQRLKAMLMGPKADLQPTEDVDPVLDQPSQQGLQRTSVGHSASSLQARPAGLLGAVQNLPARLWARTQSQQQQQQQQQVQLNGEQHVPDLSGSAGSDASLHRQASCQLPPLGSADPGLGSSAGSDASLHRQASCQLPPLGSADPGLGSSTGAGTGKPAARLQRFARLPWRRDSSAGSSVSQAPDTEPASTASEVDANTLASTAAAPYAADKGMSLDAAVGQPVSFLRSFSQKLPSFSRRGSSRTEQTPTLDHPAAAETPTQSTAGVAGSRLAEQAELNTAADASKQQPSAWQRLGSQLQQAKQGASSRVKAVASFLPSYPAYVHIGSHQILLPAAPALTEAVQSAQQQGPAEQQRQALLMHSMAAYRGRAVAICRSALQWDPSPEALEVTLSTGLATPLDVSLPIVTIPPLPYKAPAATPKPGTQVQQSLHPPDKPRAQAAAEVVLPQPSSRLIGRSSLLTLGHKQQQQPSAHQQPVRQHPLQRHPKAVRAGQSADENGQAVTKSAVSEEQEVSSDQQRSGMPPRSSSAQQQPPIGQQQRLGGKNRETGWKGPVRPSALSAVLQSDQALADGAALTSGSASADQAPWFSTASVRWPAQGKARDVAKLGIQIKAHGSTHGMPVKGQLQCLGQAWHKVRLVNPNSKMPDKPAGGADVIEAAATQISTMADRLRRLLPWGEAVQPAPGPATDAMLFEADVPIGLLQMLVERLQHQRTASVAQLDAGGQQHTKQSREPKMLKLKLQTDFVVQEYDVEARLPVVWLLGPNPVDCKAVWHLLTQQDAPELRAPQTASDGDTPDQLEDATKPFGQRLKQRLGRLAGKDPSSETGSLQLPSATTAGIDYMHVRQGSLPFVDLLSIVALTMRQMSQPDTKQKLPMTGISGRMRAMYHRRELQSMQQELQKGGLPDAFVFVSKHVTDDRVSAGLADLSSQLRASQIALLGVSVGMQDNANNLKQIGPKDWFSLPQDIQSRSSANTLQLRRHVHAVMHCNMMSPKLGKL